MSLGRLVPWTSWEEWEQVGDWLQSADPAAVQRGLDRVAAWRVRGRVPLGVDSTACFVETRLSDQRGNLGHVPLRMQYSLAVVRMVNGIADSSQRGRVAASVASLAAAAGLPRLLVDLRHEATHNELPSLAALRGAAAAALAWLRDNYWRRQAENIETNLAKIDALVGEFLASHVAAAAKAAAAAAVADDDSDSDGERGAAAAASHDGDYNVAAARKQRQALLTELRVSVPRPAAGMLARGLLRAQRAASGGSPPAVLERALTHAVKHLREGWPELPSALLAAAARALGPSGGADGNGAPGEGPIDVELWFAAFEAPGNGGAPALSEAAARAVLATALASLAAQAQTRLLLWAANAGGDVKTEPDPNTAALLSLIELSARCCGADGDGADLRRRCDALVARFCGGGDDDVAIAPALLAEAQALQAALAAAKKRERALDADGAGKPGGKWKVRRDWAPCAIGMLPSAVDPNGRLPRLEGGGPTAAAPVTAEAPTARAAEAKPARAAASVEEEGSEDDGAGRCSLRGALEGLEAAGGGDRSDGNDGNGPGAAPAARRCPPPPTSVLPLV